MRDWSLVGPALRETQYADGRFTADDVRDAMLDIASQWDTEPAPRQVWQGRNGLELIVEPHQRVVIAARWRANANVPDAGPGYVPKGIPKASGGGQRRRRYDSSEELAGVLGDAGHDVTLRSSGHYQVGAPDGTTVTFPGTSSDWRSLLNATALMRRHGLNV